MTSLLERLNDLRNHYSLIGDKSAADYYSTLIFQNTPPGPPPPPSPSTFRPMHWDPAENWNTGLRQNPPAQRQNPPAQRQNPPAQRQNPPAQRQNPPAQRQNPPAQRQNPPVQRQNPAQSQNAPNPLNATAPEFIPQRQGGKSRQHNKINKRVKKSRNKKIRNND